MSPKCQGRRNACAWHPLSRDASGENHNFYCRPHLSGNVSGHTPCPFQWTLPGTNHFPLTLTNGTDDPPILLMTRVWKTLSLVPSILSEACPAPPEETSSLHWCLWCWWGLNRRSDTMGKADARCLEGINLLWSIQQVIPL